jgi:hypothetical protein
MGGVARAAQDLTSTRRLVTRARNTPNVSASARRRDREPPSDAEIERGLRERAVSDPRAAEILLTWLQRVRSPEATPGVDLDAISEARLERLHAGLVKLASMDDTVLAALVEHVLAGDELGSNSSSRMPAESPFAHHMSRNPA